MNKEEPTEEPQNEAVTAASMRRLAFDRIDDDYYLGGQGGEDPLDSDDDVSSDDEVKSALRKLAGYEDKKEVTKDAFGRTRRRSEFEDEMDDELDRSIGEYACEHMGASSGVKIEEIVEAEEDDCEVEDENWRQENAEVERKMAALELLPYDVDLTDSEVDPEMPAAVQKSKTGEAIKLVYSCKRGEKFDIEDRKRRQKERRLRVAASRQPEKKRRQEMIKSVVETYSKNDMEKASALAKKRFAEVASSSKHTPLSSILKKPKKDEVKEEKMEEDDGKEEGEEEEETNPIKKAAKERQKEIEKNDELLYDDMEDDDNEKWVKEQQKKAGNDGGDDKADGVLSCPGCMVELSRDSQRHEIYKTQYRAMFVTNCRLEDQKMAVNKTGKEKRRMKQQIKKREKAGGSVPQLEDNDLFVQVKCASCGTLVAMMDDDEVYHFFNVLTGYA